MEAENIRSYEISIWTLQDSFITVLKSANVENKGQVENSLIELNTDGTQTLNFSIPMYLYTAGVQSENPIWYNTINGNIIENMRKIKVILNKAAQDEEVYEFLIIKVNERHEEDQLYCDVACEGLAFHELGKIGYKISLSSEKFYDEDMAWFQAGAIGQEPRANIQYWLNKFMKPFSENLGARTWGYSIEMDWTAFSQNTMRRADTIYEDEYVSSWTIENNSLVPNAIQAFQEKERLVEIEESNVYNITQELAETFGVFCKYKYLYDDNYHIVGRKVIFYNNFMAEKDGYIDMSYPHSANSIKREIDSTDLVTKMYVRPVDNDNSASGLTTIMDVGANKGREDYILNFDYLYSIGTITQEQYDEIKKYQAILQSINLRLAPLDEELITLKEKVPDLEAKITVATNSIQLDKERISGADDLLNALTDGTSKISITEDNPDSAVLLQDLNSQYDSAYYLKIKTIGVLPETIKIYKTWKSTNASGSKLSGQITGGTIEYDEFGNVSQIKNIFMSNVDMRTIYLIYDYTPKLYYENVKRTWTARLEKDIGDEKNYKDKLTEVNNKIEQKENLKISLLNQKKEIVTEFERMMGPALREGYWQPDDYKDYGDKYTDTIVFPTRGDIDNGVQGVSGYLTAFWDNELFDDEQKAYYELTINQKKRYYPCIDLSGQINYVKEHINELSFMFYDYTEVEGVYPRIPRNLRNFSVGSECQFGFAQIDNKIKPVLILTGIEAMTDEQIAYMKNSGDPRIGVLSTTISGSSITTIISSSFKVTSSMWLPKDGPITLYYPRFKINSLAMKTSSDQLGVVYNEEILDPYEDYYTLIREDSYYITIKPAVMLRQGSIALNTALKFSISNADTAIYLDAVQVLKENAYPKVSYTITPSVLDKKFLRQTYWMLNRLVHINDTKLKLQNIQGYISKVILNLDQPHEDEIEIKNYKNKFEDLFSTIVARTEQMKKNSYIIGMAANAFSINGGLTPQSFEATLTDNKKILQEFLESGLDSSSVIKNKLIEIFNEAGKILSGANNSIMSIQALNTENAAILSSFAEDVRASLTPIIYTQSVKPFPFKVGDIWKKTNDQGVVLAEYIAITDSNELNTINADDLAGWTRTYDGSIAAITGAGLDIDAAAGTISIKAKSQIDLASGDIYITGNKSVNIGSKWINIGSTGGINIVNSAITTNSITNNEGKITNATSTVLLDKNGIELAAANGIVIKSGAGIDIKASNSVNTSAVVIDKDKGIWLGANKGINLYSGITKDGVVSGASVSIEPERLLFGVSTINNETSVIEMSRNYTIIAANSTQKQYLKDTDLTKEFGKNSDQTGGIVGAKFSVDGIGFAVGSGNTKQVFLMNKDGLTLASGVNISDSSSVHGSYVKISGKGIDLGTSGDMYLNTNNIKLQTNYSATDGTNTIFAVGTNLSSYTPGTTSSTLSTWAANENNTGLIYNKSGLYIAGTIYARAGSFKGAITATSLYIGDINYLNDVKNISNISTTANSKAQVFRQSTAPTGNGKFQTGDIWHVTGTGTNAGCEYIASANANGSNDANKWVLVSTSKMTGAKLVVDAAAGTVTMSAANTVTIASGQTLSLVANGAVNITGNGGVNIKSGGNFTVESGGNFNLTSTNFTVAADGTIEAKAGTVGGWSLSNSMLVSGSTTNKVGMSANTATSNNISYSTTIPKGNNTAETRSGYYAFWAGADNPANAPFRVTRDGTVFVEKLISKETIDSGGSQTVVYNIYNLSDSTNSSGGGGGGGGSGGGGGVDFNPTGNMSLSGSWSGNTYTATMKYKGSTISTKTTSISVASSSSAPSGIQGTPTNATEGYYYYASGTGTPNGISRNAIYVPVVSHKSTVWESAVYVPATKGYTQSATVTLTNNKTFTVQAVHSGEEAYNAGKNSVTISSIENITDYTVPGTYNLTAQIKATASNNATSTKGITINAYAAYSAGWTAAYPSGGNLSITSNGTYNVTSYNTVSVQVPSSSGNYQSVGFHEWYYKDADDSTYTYVGQFRAYRRV